MEVLPIPLPPAALPYNHTSYHATASPLYMSAMPPLYMSPMQPLPAATGGPSYRVVALVQWSSPYTGWYKLNFDRSVKYDGSGRASIGGVIRDCHGRNMLAFTERTQHAGVGVVEARALMRTWTPPRPRKWMQSTRH